jgi:hypothetical protein
MTPEGFRLSRSEIFGFIFGLIGFMIHVTDRSTRTVNGVETVVYEYDYAAAGFGAVAVLFAMRAMLAMQSRTASPRRVKNLHLATAAAIALLGLYQIASGAGVLRAG